MSVSFPLRKWCNGFPWVRLQLCMVWNVALTSFVVDVFAALEKCMSAAKLLILTSCVELRIDADLFDCCTYS